MPHYEVVPRPEATSANMPILMPHASRFERDRTCTGSHLTLSCKMRQWSKHFCAWLCVFHHFLQSDAIPLCLLHQTLELPDFLMYSMQYFSDQALGLTLSISLLVYCSEHRNLSLLNTAQLLVQEIFSLHLFLRPQEMSQFSRTLLSTQRPRPFCLWKFLADILLQRCDIDLPLRCLLITRSALAHTSFQLDNNPILISQSANQCFGVVHRGKLFSSIGVNAGDFLFKSVQECLLIKSVSYCTLLLYTIDPQGHAIFFFSNLPSSQSSLSSSCNMPSFH